MTAHSPSLRDRILGDEFLLGDGACGTELQTRGLPVGTPPELWTLEQPDIVRQVAFDYFAAGSEMVLTNTFGANRVRLGRLGLGERIEEINREAVRLVRSVVPEVGFVVASVGPTGADLSVDEYRSIYAEQTAILLDAGVDGVCVETVCSTDEGLAAVDAVGAASDLPIILSFVVVERHGSLATLDGEDFATAIRRMGDSGVDAVGVNCIDGEIAEEACRQIRSLADLSVYASPNAGVPDRVGERLLYPVSDSGVAEGLAGLVQFGASAIAGCCGTGPACIAALAKKLGRQKHIVRCNS